jgi:cytochrome c553
MKRILIVLFVVLAAASFAAAQNYSPSTDVLGAHLNYGRGCTACHAPHSGVYGNGNAKTADSTSGNVALWGQDVGSLYGQTITTGGTAGGNVPETLPTSFNATTPDVAGLLTCLSCHDGNYATGAMMKNQVYETLPTTYGTSNLIPTLLGRDGTTVGNYLNDHPVGLNAVMSCGGTYDWDCTISATGKVQMTGPNSSKFVTNYGFFVSPGVYNNQPVVVCTTCHNQHLMNVVKVTASKSGLTPGYYQTMFFIRAPYNPSSMTAGSNQTAQFCRQCHGGESNEMNNGTAVTIF